MKKDELFLLLNTIAKGIADTFGPDCETLIQDLDTTDHRILSIYHGHVSGRQTGSVTDILGSTSDSSLDLSRLQQPHVGMLAKRGGRKIKSTTLPFAAEDGVLGLGINFDYTNLALAEQALKALTAVNGYLYDDIRKNQPSHIDALLQEASRSLSSPLKQLNKKERHQLLTRLHLNHFFEQQRAIPYLAEQLDVSRYTIYKDLKELGFSD
ncbi:MAG: PAS domain-containing protein [Lachnospiraceae bacterium]|nr:PAS domain-containing protein [Lachnospiraceae bacterium]